MSIIEGIYNLMVAAKNLKAPKWKNKEAGMKKRGGNEGTEEPKTAQL